MLESLFQSISTTLKKQEMLFLMNKWLALLPKSFKYGKV